MNNPVTIDADVEGIQSVGQAATKVVEKAGKALAKRADQALVSERREPLSESAVIFQIIERAARDPNVDLDKMERLMAMRDRELSRTALAAFNAAMKAAQAEIPQVVRDKDNDQTKSRYATYEAISEAIQPIITKHGFSCSFGEADSPKTGHMRIICDVAHEAGHTKQYHADIPIDAAGIKGNANKTATHAYGSTKSYGRRYLKLDIFDVAVKDADDDGNAADAPADERISEEQAVTIRKLIEDTGTPIDKFCQWAKIDAVPDLHASNFDKAVSVLSSRKRAA